jgi:hypothetical protein
MSREGLLKLVRDAALATGVSYVARMYVKVPVTGVTTGRTKLVVLIAAVILLVVLGPVEEFWVTKIPEAAAPYAIPQGKVDAFDAESVPDFHVTASVVIQYRVPVVAPINTPSPDAHAVI